LDVQCVFRNTLALIQDEREDSNLAVTYFAKGRCVLPLQTTESFLNADWGQLNPIAIQITDSTGMVGGVTTISIANGSSLGVSANYTVTSVDSPTQIHVYGEPEATTGWEVPAGSAITILP